MSALTTASNLSSAISIEPSVSDVREEKVVSDFMSKGCDCRFYCSQKFSEERILETRSHYAYLTHDELDLIILGQLNAFSNCTKDVSTAYRHSPTECKKNHNSITTMDSRYVAIFFDSCTPLVICV